MVASVAHEVGLPEIAARDWADGQRAVPQLELHRDHNRSASDRRGEASARAGIAFRPQHGDDLLLGGCGPVLSLLVLANIYPQVLDKPSSDDVRSQCLAYEEWEFFLTSSMLTESAFTPNMALGLLITCGVLLQQLKQHFLGLIQNGVLVSVQ